MKIAFVACGARFGSTLLRFLLDAHQDVSCGPETEPALFLKEQVRFNAVLGREGDPLLRLQTVLSAARCEPPVWVDKSLTNALNLELLAEHVPDAKFILLHRQPMDFIANALEACPWGLDQYGFLPFAAQTPGDSVGALARYWVDRETRLVEFALAHPDRAISLRYEHLVARPDEEMKRVWDLLDVPHDDVAERAFDVPHLARGMGDHEIWHDRGITDRSIGAGASIPRAKIAGALRQQVNALCQRLEFPEITDEWGAGEPFPEIGPGELVVRAVDHHEVVWELRGSITTSVPCSSSLVAIEESALNDIKAGTLNVGVALRSGLVRTYGHVATNYEEETALFRRVMELI